MDSLVSARHLADMAEAHGVQRKVFFSVYRRRLLSV